MARNEIRCSFCGKTESQVMKLLKGPNGVYICDACVELCSEIIEEEMGEEENGTEAEEINLLKPEEILFSKTYTLSFSSSDQITFSKPISTSIFAVISAYTLLYCAFVNIGNSSKKNKRHSLRSKMARIEDFLFISLEFDSKLSLVYCFSYSYPST